MIGRLQPLNRQVMMPTFPLELQSPRLRLQAIADLHAPSLFEHVTTDPDVTRYLTWHPHRELDQAYAMVERCQRMTEERIFAISLQSADPSNAMGTIAMRRSVRGRVDLGYMLSRSLWGQGLMTEAIRAVIDWSLGQQDIWRVAGVCDVENASSAKALEKGGMSLEGILRCWGWHPKVSDVPRDCFSYAIVRTQAD